MVKVVYVIPTHFDTSSVIAGAERYAYGLAKAMSRKSETCLITFSDKTATRRDGDLTIKYYRSLLHVGGVINPLSFAFLRDCTEVDVIHCLQFRTIVTELSILFGALKKKKVFVTDLAGGTRYNLSTLLPVWKGVQEFLLISEYNRRLQLKLPVPTSLIYGGVDASRFAPTCVPKTRRFLYVGRIFPLKGIHDLIDALPDDATLDVVGQSHDAAYLSRLNERSVGKKITFHHDLSDAQLIEKYNESLATVIPSHVDGGFTTAMESLACSTPVVATKIGSLPEIVEDEASGFLVPARDPAALRKRMEYLLAHPEKAHVMGKRGREAVLKRFTWDAVAERCLASYRLSIEESVSQ